MQEQDLIEWIITLWRPYFQQKLTQDDAQEIIENLRNYLNLLRKWKHKEIDNQRANACVVSLNGTK